MSAASPGAPGEDTDTRSTGPGHLLRSARESAGIGLRDVSAQLRLDERTVSALESDDFKDLPAPTFVRGYLRGYARLLGVPVGPVMEAYDREGFNPPDLVADIAETPDASTTDFPVRLASLGVVGALVILVVLWWNNQAFNERPVPAPAPADRVEPALSIPVPPPATAEQSAEDRTAAMQGGVGSRDESGPDPDPILRPTPPEPAPTAPAMAGSAAGANPGGDATSPIPPVPPATPASPAPVPSTGADAADQAIARAEGVLERTRSEVNAIVSGASGTASDSGSDTTATPSTAAASGNGSAAPAAADSADEGRLIMRFPIESWVEVYDRADKRLFYNLAKPGKVVEVTGAPPIRILLGRTRGVTVTYNGEAVDLAPFIERGVARLTLGQ